MHSAAIPAAAGAILEPDFAGSAVSALASEPTTRLVVLGKAAVERAGSFGELRDIRSKAAALEAHQRAQGPLSRLFMRLPSCGSEPIDAWVRCCQERREGERHRSRR